MALLTKPVTATVPVHTVLPASDIHRAERFYRDTLGMRTETQAGAGPAFVAYAGEGTWLFVYETTARPAEATTAVFMVDRLDDAMEDLRERGIVFEDYTYPEWRTVNGVATFADGSRSAWFKDTEGNIINLVQM